MEVVSLGWRTDLMIRAAEGSQVSVRDDCIVMRSPAAPEFWWGNFLLLPELKPGSGRWWLNRFAAEFPGAAHVAIGVDRAGAGTALEELTRCGLGIDRTAVLTAAAVNPPARLNPDVIVRPLEGDDDWRQAKALRTVVSAGGPGDDPTFIAGRVAAERALAEAGPGTWFGAFLDGNLAAQLGIVSGGSGLARYQNVETAPSARRLGLAGTLVWRAGQAVLDAGATTLVIAADPDYHALRLYESVGFRRAEEQVSFCRPGGP